MEKRVADPVLWMSEAQDTIIETEDEVPVWIGISSSKKVYSERVVQNRRSFEEARKKRRKQQELPAPESSPAPAHQPADVNKAETLEEDQFGLFQLRGEEKADETRKESLGSTGPASRIISRKTSSQQASCCQKSWWLQEFTAEWPPSALMESG